MKNIYDISNLDRVKELELKGDLVFKERPPGLSIIILNLDKPNFILPLIDCLLNSSKAFELEKISFEVIVGDTGSTDKNVLEKYASLESPFKVVRNLKYHFSKNNNSIAFDDASYDTLLFLNNDTLINDQDTLLNIYKSLKQSENIGIAGAVLLFENKRIQHAGIEFYLEESMEGYFPFHKNGNENIDVIQKLESVRNFPAVTGAFLMIKWNVFFEVRGFDEHYNKEGQDIDLCMKVKRLGYSIILTNFGVVFHFENGTRKKGEEDSSDRKRLVRKWNNFIKFGLEF